MFVYFVMLFIQIVRVFSRVVRTINTYNISAFKSSFFRALKQGIPHLKAYELLNESDWLSPTSVRKLEHQWNAFFRGQSQ